MPAVQFFAKMENNRQDDGSLAFLQIEPDANNKHFNCSEITQQKLINLSFWVIDFLDDVKTKFGTGRFLVKIKFNKEDPEGTTFCLKLDIRKFYPSINHDVLKSILRRKLKDKRLLCLLDEIIDSADGVPIGNYLSQYFANLYLTYFDHWIKEQKRVKHYFRYADDIVILASDKSYLHSLMGEIRAYLGDLKLEVKGNWQVFPVAARGIDFVGYVFFHTHTRMRKGIKKTFCRRLAKLNKRKRPLSEKNFKQAICPWWGWAKSCDSKHLIKKLSKTSKYEIKFKR